MISEEERRRAAAAYWNEINSSVNADSETKAKKVLYTGSEMCEFGAKGFDAGARWAIDTMERYVRDRKEKDKEEEKAKKNDTRRN